MPGIVGLISKMPRARAEQELRRMVATLRHDPSYTTGTWIDESMGVYVGWVARKNSFSDDMPVRNEQGDTILVFSGEEFPEPGTARRLRSAGHQVQEHGPAYLVHLYEENPDFLKQSNGRFHGLLIDQKRGKAILFNDRYGMHRLYFHEATDAFYFAAEAKAIVAVRPELRRANLKSVGEFVACSCILENRTLFEDVYALPAGSAWVFRNGALENKSAYFQPREWEQLEPLKPEAYYQELREVFVRNLPRYFNGGEPVAMSLTGGIDTRVIMAWRKPEPNSLPCYTFGGMLRDCKDVLVARHIADLCGQSHTVIPVGQDFLSRFPEYAERSIYITEGTVDLSRTADLYVNQQAREIAPVRMAGTYGSEVLCQLAMFKPMQPMPGLFRSEMLDYVRQARDTYAAIRREHPVTFAAVLQSPWYHSGVLALEQASVTVRSPYLDSDFIRTVYRAPKDIMANGDVRLRLLRDGDPALAAIPTDRGVGGSANGISATAIRNYLEFTFKAEYAYDYGMPQWLARIDHGLAPLRLERCFLGRHKFQHYRVWFRDALAEYVRQMLLDSRSLSRPYIERKSLESLVHGHLKGNRNYTTEIHKVLTLELLHRQFLDSGALRSAGTIE